MSGTNTPTSEGTEPENVSVNPCLGELQTEEYRGVLDVVAQLRKCGLESVLSLPQIVCSHLT